MNRRQTMINSGEVLTREQEDKKNCQYVNTYGMYNEYKRNKD